MSDNILQYESEVWATADLLIASSIKQSDFPKYMMPFFALIMLESRLVRHAAELEKELSRDDIDDFVAEFQEFGIGYNDLVIRKGKTLAVICQNDKTFETDFHAYLKAFDGPTKSLLGVDKGNEEEKFLDISGVTGQLKKKKILFGTVKKWSEIDLVPFNNSEITTLEEHIKRKWADISAETAGEQYTPDDVIGLIADIIVSKLENNGRFLTIYDPTCGGGNLLFGVEDRIKEAFNGNRPTKTFGEDWSDSLYALAKIESRFRPDSQIEHGNTLTNIRFIEKKFDVVVANPPYGLDWKGYKADIERDTTGRFQAGLPSVGDGQFLFTQHIISQMAATGLAVVVHNGSTLFSGDAGSGESNIRKWLFDQDLVEAIVQLPTDEFFNTGIYTYLWIFNKQKPTHRAGQVLLLNASELCRPLKKSKGKKRKEIDPASRATIVQTLQDFATLPTFTDQPYARAFSKHHFYYNRQAIQLTNLDEDGQSYEACLPTKTNALGQTTRAKSIKLQPLRLYQSGGDQLLEWTDFTIHTFDKATYQSLPAYNEQYVGPALARFDYKEGGLRVETEAATYYYDPERETLVEEAPDGTATTLGCGRIVVKSSLKKATARQPTTIVVTVELTPDYQKDYEIIPFHPDSAINQQYIADFLARYVTRPFSYLDCVVGAEINFNKVFYQPKKLGKVKDIRKELAKLEIELTKLEKKLY
jgi:type I restriction enzyme M protein